MSDLFDTIFGVPKPINKKERTQPIKEPDLAPRLITGAGEKRDKQGYYIDDEGQRVEGSCSTCGKSHRVMVQMAGRYADRSDDYYYCFPCYIEPINRGRYGLWCSKHRMQHGKRKKLPPMEEWLEAYKAKDFDSIDEKYKLGKFRG